MDVSRRMGSMTTYKVCRYTGKEISMPTTCYDCPYCKGCNQLQGYLQQKVEEEKDD